MNRIPVNVPMSQAVRAMLNQSCLQNERFYTCDKLPDGLVVVAVPTLFGEPCPFQYDLALRFIDEPPFMGEEPPDEEHLTLEDLILFQDVMMKVFQRN